jgi:hypothetical protein
VVLAYSKAPYFVFCVKTLRKAMKHGETGGIYSKNTFWRYEKLAEKLFGKLNPSGFLYIW